MTCEENGVPRTSGHGGNVWAAARRLGTEVGNVIDLSTNTFAAMAGATATTAAGVMASHAEGGAFLHYPDPDAARLRKALALAEGVDAGRLLPGAGASELIWAVLAGLRPRRALFVGPLFAQYARACDALGIPWEVVTPPENGCREGNEAGFAGGFAPTMDTLGRVEASRRDGVDLIVACSPSNPGTAVMIDPRPLLEAVGERVLLLDVSYRDFLPGKKEGAGVSREGHGYPALLHAASGRGQGRVILVGSMTKFYCCPGFRLGFVVSDPDIIARTAAARPEWSVPALSEEVGEALLAETSVYREALPGLRADVDRLCRLLERSGRFRLVLPGVSFATAALRSPADAVPLREHLLVRHRILIRACDGIPGMPPGFVRIQARPGDALSPLARGLADFSPARG